MEGGQTGKMDEPIISPLLTQNHSRAAWPTLLEADTVSQGGRGGAPQTWGRTQTASAGLCRRGISLSRTGIGSALSLRVVSYFFFLLIRLQGGISSWRLNADSESEEVNPERYRHHS